MKLKMKFHQEHMEKQHERFAKQNGKTRKIRASSRHTGISAAKMEVNRGAGEMVFFSWLKQQKPGNLSTGLSMVKHRF